MQMLLHLHHIRYIELIISAIVTYVMFNELPDKSALYGILILIPSNFVYSLFRK
ncbi:membrane protein, putative [Wolbachia endosymbiont of Drosophila ananassae]|nr:membrane protein, putative [Wolbachia endosymbiont of Drosophila ananassae]